jgi:hypothetical protein
MLVVKAREAADRQVAILQRAEGQTQVQFENFVRYARTLLDLVTTVHGADGEWLSGSGTNVLEARPLPRNVARIVFESAFYHRSQTGQAPLNSFTLTLDLRRVRALDGLLGTREDVNESSAWVNGQDATWVNGVATEVRTFLAQHASPRGWLHSPQSYSVAALFGIPLSLYWVYRLDHWFHLSGHVPEAVAVAVYVYVVLLIMMLYRVTFNVVRRTFPKVEGPTRRRDTWLQSTVPGLLVLALLSDLLIQAVKAIIAKLF